MPLFNWPYTNLHSLNLDWIIRKVKELTEKVEGFDIDDAVDRWFKNHPESAVNIPDKAVKNKMLSDDIADSFYKAIYISSGRSSDTSYWIASVPAMDENNKVIKPFMHYSAALAPSEAAQALKTDLTINGALNYFYAGGGNIVCTVVNDGEILNNGSNITGTLNCSDPGLLVINKDRTHYTVPVTTDPESLLSAAIVTGYYFPLIEGGTVKDFSQITDNEGAVVGSQRNPYIGVGFTASNDMKIAICTGRSADEQGMTAAEIASLLLGAGCVDAYMFDGGGSASMTYRGTKLNPNIDSNRINERTHHYTLSFKKADVNDFIAGPYMNTGAAVNLIRKEIYRYIAGLKNQIGVSYESPLYVPYIPGDSDLDTYTQAGSYVCNPNSVAATLSNSPTNVSFRMDVRYISSQIIFQLIYDYNGDMFIRRNYIYSGENHYTDWKKCTNTATADA